MAVLGDIALVGYAADTAGKSFAFVILADISGETLNFTDNGWLAAGGFRAGEGTISYVVPANTPVGTVVTISGLTTTLNPSTSGDQILAYFGSAASPTFLFALDFADGNATYAGDATNSNTSAVPTGLTFGQNALAFGTDNGAYVGPLTGTRLEILSNIANSANWTLDDATPVTYPAGFTIGGGSETPVTINDVSIIEGNDGTSELIFTVTRGDNGGVFSVDFATQNGTATAGSDYVSTTGTINFTAGGALTQTISVTINGDTATEGNETFTVALSNLVNATGTAAIADASGTGTITNDDINVIAINVIQGAGHTSALVGQTVTTTGIVTAVDTNGFYIQTADADIDADVATSEAIFVFTSSAPTVLVGQALNVTGTVAEFIPGGAGTNNLSTTQLTAPTVAVLSSNNALPTAIILGVGGRQAPTEAIDSDNFATFNPATDGIDFFESLEAMLVTVPQPLVVAATTSNGEIFTVADAGANATNLSARGAIVTRGSSGDGLNVTNTGPGADFNPERIQIDGDAFTPGGANSIPFVNTGTVLNDVTGVVAYNFGNYEVLATTAVTVATPSILTDDVTTLTGNATTLTIASYNVLNLDPGDSATRFTNLALDIVGGLGSPDIIALQEIQDNSGPTNNGIVSASITLQMLADAISANGGPAYTFIDNPFITNNTNGGEPGGNIRVAYLYNAARVSLVEGSLATTPDAAAAFNGSRAPLAATFAFNGEEVTVINNHFTSKGGSSPLFGAVQPSNNGGAADRLVQAQSVADYVASLDPSAKVVVLGDLNEFANEESLAPLTAAGLFDLSLTLAANERYTFNFDGNAQQLDQAYVSSALNGAAALDIVHLNSEYVATSTSAADHDPLVLALTFAAPEAFGQPGDIAFVGFNADGNDDIAFVALKAIATGTVIYFNDQEWQGAGFNTGEGQLEWTATSDIVAGTVVTINSYSSAPVSNLGSVTGSSGLGSDGEIVYAYVGAPFAPTSFLAAIANDGFAISGGTLAGTGLTIGQTAIDLSNGGTNPGEDVAVFNGARFGATSFADYLASINNPASWLTQDGSGDQSIDGTAPDLPFQTTAFILGGVETQSVGFQPGAVAIAEGDEGAIAMTFTIVRTGGTTGAVDFSGTVTLGTADAADFGGTAPTAFNGQIAAGATSATVTIDVSGDTLIEADEDFTLTLTTVVNSAGTATGIDAAAASATGTITNDDAPASDLGPGDVAFTGFNSDGVDNLALTALKALAAGTILYFSDNEWNGTAWADLNESTFALTLTSDVAAGGIIKLDNIGSADLTTSNVGTVAAVPGGGGNRGIANSAEAVYVYVADAGSPLVPSAFLTAVANDGFGTALLTGTGLVAGTTALDLATVDAGADIAAFTGARDTAASFADYLPILNNAANWVTQDASGDQSADGTAPDVPFSDTVFSLAGPGLAIGGINVYDAASSRAGSTTTPVASNDIVLVRLGSIQGSIAGAESVAFANGKVYATATNANAINIHSITAQGTLVNEAPILLSGLPSYAPGGVNAVDVKNGVIAVGYENIDPTQAGFVALFNAADNSLITTVQVGILPDDVTFTPDGTKLLVANEGELLSAQGSISIIDLSGGAANAVVTNTISFATLNGAEDLLRDRGLAIAPGQSAAGDIEPEYITISEDGTRAYVTLQEVNGVAVIDLTDPSADRPLSIQPLGTIDRNLPGNALDTSDQDGGINLRNVDIQSLTQPDAIASFTVGGATYFVTANEGDARVNVADSVRLGSAGYVLDPTRFPNAAALKANADLGRLNVLTTIGDTDGDGDFDVIHTLGGRGISIFRQEADGSITKVRETGGEFEAITALLVPGSFNSNQSVNPTSRDTRSDDKGPEPEGVSIGVVNGRTYAFVGLERVGGYMVYDVTDPANATFVSYRPQTAADLGPETSAFVSAADSPTGEALLISAQEISNTVTLYSVQVQSNGDDVINGGDEGESWNGRGGNDVINGNGGDDIIDGGAGSDRIDGGAGTDTASFASAAGGVRVNLGTRSAQGPDGDFDQLISIENLLGSPFDDILVGDRLDNIVDGGAGNDIVRGAQGNDTLLGGAGNDVLEGGVGTDIFLFDKVSDGAVDVITDLHRASGDRIVFGEGVTVIAASVSYLSTGQSVNGFNVSNAANAMDLVLTLSSADGIQKVHILDAYNFSSNAFWEAELGLDLTYPRPLPNGPELLPIA